jgi:hypothetical protein
MSAVLIGPTTKKTNKQVNILVLTRRRDNKKKFQYVYLLHRNVILFLGYRNSPTKEISSYAFSKSLNFNEVKKKESKVTF